MIRLCVVFTLITSTTAFAQAKKGPRTEDQIRKDIDVQKKKLAELEAELAKFNPPKRYKQLSIRALNVGEIGLLTGVFKIRQILDDDRMIVIDDDDPTFSMIIKGKPTKGEAEGKLLSFKLTPWEVSKTEKIGNKTYYVVVPYVEPKQKNN